MVVLVLHSPGWPEVRTQFFNGRQFRESLPAVVSGFRVNVELFCLAEVFILAFALLLAVLRSLPGPVFFPLRALAIAYTDFFRGVPTILVIYILAFGAPALSLRGLPTSAFVWAVVSLVLVYSAYVAEVYRAGIESVHPSQVAAARSLGLSRWQSLRFVVLLIFSHAPSPLHAPTPRPPTPRRAPPSVRDCKGRCLSRPRRTPTNRSRRSSTSRRTWRRRCSS